MSTGAPTPTSAREAALRIILGDVAELVEKADSAASTLRDSHELIDKDLESLGALVSRVEHALQDSSQDVEAILARLRKLKDDPSAFIPQMQPAPTPALPLGKIAALMFAGSLLSAFLVLSAAIVFARPMLEQARIGKAVTKALPYIDQATRQKLEAAIQKTGS